MRMALRSEQRPSARDKGDRSRERAAGIDPEDTNRLVGWALQVQRFAKYRRVVEEKHERKNDLRALRLYRSHPHVRGAQSGRELRSWECRGVSDGWPLRCGGQLGGSTRSPSTSFVLGPVLADRLKGCAGTVLLFVAVLAHSEVRAGRRRERAVGLVRACVRATFRGFRGVAPLCSARRGGRREVAVRRP